MIMNRLEGSGWHDDHGALGFGTFVVAVYILHIDIKTLIDALQIEMQVWNNTWHLVRWVLYHDDTSFSYFK